METKEIIEHPWQRTPANLISYSSELLSSEDEFKQQIGFLLLDVGIETIFKVFLSLPDEVTGSKIPYDERQKIIEKRSFYHLVLGVEKAAGERLSNINLNKVRYFHDIRNKIYHYGDGVTPTKENQQKYEEIAKNLIEVLLGVHLKTDDDWMVNFEKHLEIIGKEYEVENLILRVNSYVMELRIDLTAAVMHLKPGWAKRSLARKLYDIWDQYPDYEGDQHWVRTENQDKRMELFNELLNLHIKDYEYIDNCLQDITYLKLAFITKQINKNPNEELEKYEDALSFLEKFDQRKQESLSNYEEIVSKSNEIITWITNLQTEIEDLIEE